MALSEGRLVALFAFALFCSGAQCAASCLEPPPPACHHCQVPCDSKPAVCRVPLVDADIPQPSATTPAVAVTTIAANRFADAPAPFSLPSAADVVRQAAVLRLLGLVNPSSVLRI